MLPDLPELKSDLQRLANKYVRTEAQRRMGVFNESPQHQIHEGEQLRIIREDGSTDESELKTASAEIRIQSDEAPNMTPEAWRAKLDGLAEDLAQQMTEFFFATINKLLEEAGQVVNLGGRSLDAEGILQILAKLRIEFDENRQMKGMSIVIPPAIRDRAHTEFARLETEPDLAARYRDLMEKKWMDWRDREASRKLVG
jgi:hypothetical protein